MLKARFISRTFNSIKTVADKFLPLAVELILLYL